MRTACLAVLLAAGAMLAPLASGAQVLPEPDDVVGTVTSTAGTDDVIGTVTSTAGTVTSTAGTVTSAAGDVTSAVGSAAGDAGTSLVGGGGADTESGVATSSPSASGSASTADTSSASRGARDGRPGRASPGRGYQSRFDRLPRRAELLLERIELGRHVQANLRRLRELLASRPRLEAAVLRSLRAELRRLRKGGLSPSERERADRLRAARRALLHGLEASAGLPGAAFPTMVAASPTDAAALASGVGPPASREAGVAGDETGATGAPSEGGVRGFLGALPRPGGADSGSWLDALVYGLVWAFVAALLVIIAREVRRVLRQG